MSLSSFEADLLSVFVKDRKKFIKFSRKIQPKHFRSESLRWTYEVIRMYYSKYKEPPTKKVFQEELMKTAFKNDKRKRFLIVIDKLYKRKIKTSLKYMEDNIAKKIEEEEALIGIDKALMQIEKGNLSAAKKELVSSVLLGTQEETVTMRVLGDWEMRQTVRKALSKIPIPKRFISTPYSKINAATKGIQLSEAATVAGLTGMGKSIIAGEFGANSLLDTLNVTHFTLENLAEQTAQRYDSRLTEIGYDTIKLYEFNKKELAHFKKVFRALKSGLTNDVVIKETVKEETNITLIDKELELLKADGFETDFLIVDSCDIMSSSRSYDSYRLERASIYWDFKFYLKVKRMAGLTTTQLKSSSKYKLSTVEDLAEAYDKARILDIVYIMSQTEDQAKDGIITFSLDKNRDGPGKINLDLFKDSARMRFLECV